MNWLGRVARVSTAFSGVQRSFCERGAFAEILDESNSSGTFINEYLFFDGKRVAVRVVSTGTSIIMTGPVRLPFPLRWRISLMRTALPQRCAYSTL